MRRVIRGALLAAAFSGTAGAQTVDQRVRSALAGLTLDQKLALAFSQDGGGVARPEGIPKGALGSAAYLPSPAAGLVPTLQISDAGLGVTNPYGLRHYGAAQTLPSGQATAATWDVAMARRGGAMIGEEAHRIGFNVLLAGGANLARDPRGGRNFEYAGEDPLLAGRIVGSTIAGIQSRHVISTVKHFAMNDLETSRMTMSANIGAAAMRESDLLAFEIAIEGGHPGAVMCSYNRVNDLYACENSYLLTKTLKEDWRYPGFVMSDWGATHTTVRAALAGLDQESCGDTIDARPFFNSALKTAVQAGEVPMTRVDDMARRVLHTIYAVGVDQVPPAVQPLDVAQDQAVAQADEEEGIVLLRNAGGVLPLARSARVAVIGGHADVGVLSGGGSSAVMPQGGSAVTGPGLKDFPFDPVYWPSSPLVAMRRAAPSAQIGYESGADVARAVEAARRADVVVIFATRWTFESMDAPDLSLPDGQDALIAAVAKVNPRTIVVLETGNPVLMPWRDKVAGILEAWYPGAGGGAAIARVLYGSVTPSGHLPITFPAAAAQLAHPDIAGVTAKTIFAMQFKTDQELDYAEGSDVGYRWFDRWGHQPLYPFGFGLSYTTSRHEVPSDHERKVL